MKILLFGRHGYIGSKVQEYFKCGFGCARSNFTQHIYDTKPDVVINATGYTGKTNVDDCEDNIALTVEANVGKPIAMAEASQKVGAKFIHISSGCIFEGYNKEWTEDDKPNFKDLIYTRTKIACDEYLQQMSNTLILRIRLPLDHEPHRKNILTKVLKFKDVHATPNSVTYLPDFMGMIKHLIYIDAYGIFNCVQRGALTFKWLLEVYGSESQKLAPYSELKQKRSNIIMSTKKLESTGYGVMPIQHVLLECCANYKKEKEKKDEQG
jgi:dTDP-4-dehydrorhamnose reductase